MAQASKRNQHADGHRQESTDSSVWITWERQRRSMNMARHCGAQLWLLESTRPYVLRVLSLGLRTLVRLARKRPYLVYVQNPSMTLAALACFFRPFLGYRLIVDRHSNFKFDTQDSHALKYRVFHFLSRYTIRCADLTIVTNGPLCDIVESTGGRGFVLPDPLPELQPIAGHRQLQRPAVACVCSHSKDEPLVELLAAAALSPGVTFYVTGNPQKIPGDIRRNAPDSVVFTGYLDDEEYSSLLADSNVVIVLTRQRYTLTCGAYEAVSLGKPLVLSDQEELAVHFRRGRILAANTPDGIAGAVARALDRQAELAAEVVSLREELREEWGRQFEILQELVGNLDGSDRK